jgi:hypothetical protein
VNVKIGRMNCNVLWASQDESRPENRLFVVTGSSRCLRGLADESGELLPPVVLCAGLSYINDAYLVQLGQL